MRGSPRLVQSVTNGYSGPPSTTAVMPSSETVGNILVAAVYWDGNTAVTVSDTAGNHWNPLTVYSNTNVGGLVPYIQLWWAQVTVPGANTVTAAQTGAANGWNDGVGVFLMEYTGLTGSPYDNSVGQIAPSGSNLMQTGNMTTTSNDLVVALFMDPCGSGTMTKGSGYTIRGLDPGWYSMAEDNIPSGTNQRSVNATGFLPGSTSDNCWHAAEVSFKVR